MQTFKDRAKPNQHQRSVSLVNYDELRRRDTATPETEFRQRRPVLDTQASVDPTAPIDISTISSNKPEKCPLTGEYAEKATDLEKSALLSECLLTETAAVSEKRSAGEPLLLSAASCSTLPNHLQGDPTATSIIKGHRRSLSLRQRFEVGYEYIVSEFEHAREVAGKTVYHAGETVWKVCHFNHLPNWMQDNEYLHWGHRPPLPSLWACAKSIFRVHTETGNIWTHGIGALLFLALFIYTFVTMNAHKTATDRFMLIVYFCGIITCLLFSTLFHTFSCYASPKVIKIFSKLDYCGISLQIIGSMIPALYYGFYENFFMYKIYISFGVVLCILSIIVSMWDKFGEPKYRSLRAIVFLTFGLSNVIPGVHWYIILDSRLVTAFGMFILQGALYVIGSLLYANRIPERFFPGKCDYIFQSHQIFHVLVVVAALVHLNGINSMADFVLHLNSTSSAASAAATAATVAAANVVTPSPPVVSVP
ncbi:Adiponectin receptor protein 2 [Tyrophagus putrescentiae]|nr:Adiponectin receptor protein 2 [Tyrophagus putrescentiae]